MQISGSGAGKAQTNPDSVCVLLEKSKFGLDTHLYWKADFTFIAQIQGMSPFLLFIFGIFLTHTDTLFISLAPRVLPCRCLQHAQKPVHALRSRVLASITWRKDWNIDEILGAHPGIRIAQSICCAPNTIGLIMGHHFHSFQNPRVGGLWGQILKQLHNLPSRGPLTIQLLALVKICSPAVFES